MAQNPPGLNDNERELLKMEYEQLCNDYRQHDKYVLDKLSAAGILFGLLGIAVAQIQDFWLKIILLVLGILFGCICSISVAKDTYYRDGYGKIIAGLSKKLGIWENMKRLNEEGYFSNVLDPKKVDKEFQLLRQIHIKPEESSVKLFGRPINLLINRRTFRWILLFYIVATVSFFGVFIGIVIGHCIY